MYSWYLSNSIDYTACNDVFSLTVFHAQEFIVHLKGVYSPQSLNSVISATFMMSFLSGLCPEGSLPISSINRKKFTYSQPIRFTLCLIPRMLGFVLLFSLVWVQGSELVKSPDLKFLI